MPQFKYIARSRTGEKIEGKVEAQDRRAALLQIERMGQVPVSVSEGGALAPEPAKSKEKKRFHFELRSSRAPRMNLREILLLTRELSDLLGSGMTLGNALHTLSKRKTNPAQDEIVTALRDEIVQGTSLSDALSKPIFIAGPEHWRELARKLDTAQVLRVDADGSIQVTAALHQRLEFVGKPPKIEIVP